MASPGTLTEMNPAGTDGTASYHYNRRQLLHQQSPAGESWRHCILSLQQTVTLTSAVGSWRVLTALHPSLQQTATLTPSVASWRVLTALHAITTTDDNSYTSSRQLAGPDGTTSYHYNRRQLLHQQSPAGGSWRHCILSLQQTATLTAGPDGPALYQYNRRQLPHAMASPAAVNLRVLTDKKVSTLP